MNTIISIGQITVAVLIIASVLLQQKGDGLGAAFGGGSSAGYASRRGLQDKLYWATVVLGVAFVALAMLQLFL
ncbi:MAG: preprotein translocase subunit SecG [bacterium]|nr:preprotein translocase subunit SecG [bacterium]MDZ4231704.1 preprotein translocase subunit SecG [Candidatus Pacearchaeota archaeon]